MKKIDRTYKFSAIVIFAAIFSLTVSISAVAQDLSVEYKDYISHLTGNTNLWTDVLVATNKGPITQTFTVTLYNAGLEVSQDSFLVQPNEEKAIYLKELDRNATLSVKFKSGIFYSFF